MNNLLLIISREYSIRVKKKGFIFTTLLMPIIMVALMLAPSLIASLNNEVSTVTLIDQSRQLTPGMLTQSGIPFIVTDEPVDSALANSAYKQILVIGENVVDDPSDITLYSRDAASFEMTMLLRENIKSAIEEIRLQNLGYENIREILDSVEADVQIKSLSLDDSGATEENNALASFLIGIIMAFILYMFILIYGQMVMMGIIEEKNNRVLEIIVTSVKPMQLMLGKLIGIGAVAVTQVLIWVGLIACIIKFIVPEIAPAEVIQAMAMLADLSYVLSISGYLLIFLIGGFLLYASIYAAIGAAVDNIQDGSQLQTFALVPVILGLVFATTAGQNPNSAFAVWLSIIPFTSPMVMMARIPSGVPAIEIIASIVALYLTIIFIVWFTAKIYRIGIFMYGKKPSIKELVKWAKYK